MELQKIFTEMILTEKCSVNPVNLLNYMITLKEGYKCFNMDKPEQMDLRDFNEPFKDML